MAVSIGEGFISSCSNRTFTAIGARLCLDGSDGNDLASRPGRQRASLRQWGRSPTSRALKSRSRRQGPHARRRSGPTTANTEAMAGLGMVSHTFFSRDLSLYPRDFTYVRWNIPTCSPIRIFIFGRRYVPILKKFLRFSKKSEFRRRRTAGRPRDCA
jgi:hypothetical protein